MSSESPSLHIHHSAPAKDRDFPNYTSRKAMWIAAARARYPFLSHVAAEHLFQYGTRGRLWWRQGARLLLSTSTTAVSGHRTIAVPMHRMASPATDREMMTFFDIGHGEYSIIDPFRVSILRHMRALAATTTDTHIRKLRKDPLSIY